MNQRKAFSQKEFIIPEEYAKDFELKVEFGFKSTLVKSINHTTIQMTTITDIESYDSSLEASRYSRSEQLACLGILSFFTYIPIMVYDIENEKDEVQLLASNNNLDETTPRLIINGDNETEDLCQLLKCMEENVEFAVTILDRIRKGLYLEKASNDANLHHDEVYLMYFGVIELLTNQYAREMKIELKDSISEKLESFYVENLFYEGDRLTEVLRSKLKLIDEIFVRNELGLKNKILFMCKKLGIRHMFLEDFVSELISTRNKVAHGRIAYMDKVIWPLPPFFSLVDESSSKLDAVFYFMTCIVQKFYGLERYHENFNSFRSLILPSKVYVKSLLKNPQNNMFTLENLESGNDFNFTFETVFYLAIHKFPKVNIDEFVNVIGQEFLRMNMTESNGPIMINISVLFADSKMKALRMKARENVEIAVRNKWYYWSNIKDLLRYLKYYEVDISWFESWINEGEYLQI